MCSVPNVNMDPENGMPVKKILDLKGKWIKIMQRRLPISEWGPKYKRDPAVGDLLAGITLGLTMVPQSLAYASLANLPMQYGLYSSYLGTMLYVIFGTVKEVSIGPTSLMALLTLQICRDLPVEYVVLLTFLSGCLVLVMGLLRLGFLVDLISPPVTSGFTSATAVIIVVAQLKGLLGLSFTAETVQENLVHIVAKRSQVRLADCLLGLVCCTALLSLRKLKDLNVSPKRARLKKLLWFVSISRNAIVVVAASTFAYLTYNPDNLLIKLSGRVEPGLPPVSLPPFTARYHNTTVPFGGMVMQLSSGLAMMPLVMVLANIAIAKAFSAGGRVDATQEMLTLGLVNIAGSFVHAMPTCGAFTRSAVSHASGVRTPAAGFYSGIITLLALIFMTKYFYFIPKACLSSVLICAVIFMIDISIVGRLWRTSRSDVVVLALTFVVSVGHSVELGVLAGSLAALAVLLHAVARPPATALTLKVEGGREVVRVRPSLALTYLNESHFSQHVLGIALRVPRLPILVDCSLLSFVDHSAGQALERMAKKLESDGRQLVVYNASEEVGARLERSAGLRGATLHARSAGAALAERSRAGSELDESIALLDRGAGAGKQDTNV